MTEQSNREVPYLTKNEQDLAGLSMSANGRRPIFNVLNLFIPKNILICG